MAYALKEACYAAWNNDPSQCAAAAESLGNLAARLGTSEVNALAAWAQGIAALAGGQMEDALAHLDSAANGFERIGLLDLAAETQVPKLVALATLGRYEEAETCGLTARDTFSSNGNLLAAGKIELNLGHMRMQRDSYADAELLFRSALVRFVALHNAEHVALAQMALADALTWQRKFDMAAALYAQTIDEAQTAGLRALEATSALNLGVLEQLRGRHDQALRWLETARRMFAELHVPHQTALADERLANVYLDLGLADQALAAYEAAVPAYASSGMRYEQAWALADRGRALLKLGASCPGRAIVAACTRSVFGRRQRCLCRHDRCAASRTGRHPAPLCGRVPTGPARRAGLVTGQRTKLVAAGTLVARRYAACAERNCDFSRG